MRGRTAASAPATDAAGANFLDLVQAIGREKGIDVEVLIAALEDAITTASRKQKERAPTTANRRPAEAASQEVLVCRLNRTNGQLQLFARKLVVERPADVNLEIDLAQARAADPEAALGGHVELARSVKGLGRIEAQAAKHVIFQKVRDAERDMVYNEFAPKVGQLVTGNVKRFERGDILVEIGRSEGILPRRFQSRTEMYSQGDRLRALVVEANRTGKGPQVVLSRTDASLLLKLFELEVPEIYDGTVVLKYAVREPGERTKVAVASQERDVDPVGACVGMKGTRVQAIIRELRGEKVDIVQWSNDVPTFAAHALNPAKVGRVTVGSNEERALEVVVDDTQLSLAIGKKGQNVRLASKLVGWRIDIKSEGSKRREVEQELTAMSRRSLPLGEVPFLSDTRTAADLAAAGLKTVNDLLKLHPGSAVGALTAEELSELRDRAERFLGSNPDDGEGSRAVMGVPPIGGSILDSAEP